MAEDSSWAADEALIKAGSCVVVDCRAGKCNDALLYGIERRIAYDDLGWRSGVVKVATRGDGGKLKSLEVDLGGHASLELTSVESDELLVGPRRAWRFDGGDEAVALKFAAHKVTEWWFLECGSGGLLRMPFSPEETLVVGREHAAEDEARYVSRVHCRLARNGDKGAYPTTTTGMSALDDSWTLQFLGQTPGEFFREYAPPAGESAKRPKGTQAIKGYCYRMGVGSAVALLPGGGVARLVKKPVAVDALAAGGERDFVLRRSPTQLFGGGEGRRLAAEMASAPPDRKRARGATGAPTTTKAGRHSRVARRFFFPLEVARFSFKIEATTKTGWNAHPVALAPVPGDWGRSVDLLRPGDSKRVVRLTDNSITGGRVRYNYRGWFGSYCGDGCRSVAGPGQAGIALRSLLACATSKIQFVQLSATVSDALPETWAPDVHGLFPPAFRNVATAVLLARQRRRNAWRDWRDGDRALPPPSARSLAALSERDVFAVLRYLSHDPALVNTAGQFGKDDEAKADGDDADAAPPATFQRLEIAVSVNDRFMQPEVEDDLRRALWLKHGALQTVGDLLKSVERHVPPDVPALRRTIPLRDDVPEAAFAMDALLGAAVVTTTSPEAAQPAGVRTALKSYQKRALRWMLFRERALPEADAAPTSGRLHPAWRSFKLPSGLQVFQSRLNEGVWTMRRFEEPPETMRGGLLCEQMGLGKTLEIISLIKAHPAPDAMDVAPPAPPVVVEEPAKGRTRPKRARGGAKKAAPDATPAKHKAIASMSAAEVQETLLGLDLRPPQSWEKAGTIQVRVDKAREYRSRRSCKTTVVVVPPTLLGQWESQILEHCDPDRPLKVLKLPVHHPGRPRKKPTRPGYPKLLSDYRHFPGGYNSPESIAWRSEGESKKRSRENQKRLDAHKKLMDKFRKEDKVYQEQVKACAPLCGDADDLATYDVVIVALPTLLFEVERLDATSAFSELEFWRLVVDEAHELLPEEYGGSMVYGDDYATRSENSAARRLLRRDSFAIARAHCWLVSGTPLRSRFDDLSHLLALLDSKVWSGDLISHVSSRYSANDPEGSEALDLSRRVIKTVMWRATKELTDAEAVLPPVRYADVELTLNDLEFRSYARAYAACRDALSAAIVEHNDPGARRYRVAIRLPYDFDALWRTLRVAACHPKLQFADDGFLGSTVLGSSTKIDALGAILARLRRDATPEDPVKMVVFSAFLPLLHQTKAVLWAKFRVKAEVLSRDSEAPIVAFNDDPHCAVILVSTEAGGGSSGLNLTRARHVALMEASTNGGLEDQAIARVRRLGQRADEVVVHRLLAAGSIEHAMLRVQARRKQMYQVIDETTEHVVRDDDTMEMISMFGLADLLETGNA